ncbi:hypothetical protein JCM3770_002985 [Rhodotorula araucariae]
MAATWGKETARDGHDKAASSTPKRMSRASSPPRREKSLAGLSTNSPPRSLNGSRAIPRRLTAVSVKWARLVKRVKVLLPSGAHHPHTSFDRVLTAAFPTHSRGDRQLVVDTPTSTGPVPHKLHYAPAELANNEGGGPTTESAVDIPSPLTEDDAPLAKDIKVTSEGAGTFVRAAQGLRQLSSALSGNMKEEMLVDKVMSTDDSSGSSDSHPSSELLFPSSETGGTSPDEEMRANFAQGLPRRLQQRNKGETRDRHLAAKLATLVTEKARSGGLAKKQLYEPQVLSSLACEGKGKARAITPPPVPVPTDEAPVAKTPWRPLRRAYYGIPGTPTCPPSSSSSSVTLNEVYTPTKKRSAHDFPDDSSPSKKLKDESTGSNSPYEETAHLVGGWGQYAGLPATFAASYHAGKLVDAASEKSCALGATAGEDAMAATVDGRHSDNGATRAGGTSVALASSGDEGDGDEPSDDEWSRPRAGHAADESPASDAEADDEDEDDEGLSGGDSSVTLASGSCRTRSLGCGDDSTRGDGSGTSERRAADIASNGRDKNDGKSPPMHEGARGRSQPASPSPSPSANAHANAGDSSDQDQDSDEDAAPAAPSRALVRQKSAPAPGPTRAVAPSTCGRAAQPAAARFAPAASAGSRRSQAGVRHVREVHDGYGNFVRMTVTSAAAGWFLGPSSFQFDDSSSDESDEGSGESASEDFFREDEEDEEEADEEETDEPEEDERSIVDEDDEDDEDELVSSHESDQSDQSDYANYEGRFVDLATDEE